MRPAQLNDTVQRGLGRAARALGAWCDAFRPRGVVDPLQASNRFLKLQASFFAPGKAFVKPDGYGHAGWWALLDSAYTRPGDYILRPSSRAGAADGGTWFVASQQSLMPVLCVRANRVVRGARPGSAELAGVNLYGGVTAATAVPLFSGWPASVLSDGGGGLDRTNLPADAPAESWRVLLPKIEGIVLRGGDLLYDDLGRTGVVSAAELTELGWRLVVRQATT